MRTLKAIFEFFRRRKKEEPKEEKVVKQEGKREPIIYQCRNGDKIDMSTWPKSHLDFIKRAYWMYLQNPPVEKFGEMFWQEPLGSYAGKPGLREIPLARVFMDLETRLSIKQGECTPTFDSPIEPDWPL